MDRKLWLLVLSVMCLMVVATGQKAETKSEPFGQSRYQLAAAQEERAGKLVFVLDTQTGRVWQYQSAMLGTGNIPTFPETFVSVRFGIPDQRLRDFGLKNSASEDTRP